jgi:hypothetical protein
VQLQPAVVDRALEANGVLRRSALVLEQKRPGYLLDVDPALNGFDRERDRNDAASGLVWIGLVALHSDYDSLEVAG